MLIAFSQMLYKYHSTTCLMLHPPFICTIIKCIIVNSLLAILMHFSFCWTLLSLALSSGCPHSEKATIYFFKSYPRSLKKKNAPCQKSIVKYLASACCVSEEVALNSSSYCTSVIFSLCCLRVPLTHHDSV